MEYWPEKVATHSSAFIAVSLAVAPVGPLAKPALSLSLSGEEFCQGLDPGSGWPTSHLISASANTPEGHLLELRGAAWHDANQSEGKNTKYPQDSIAFLFFFLLKEALRTRVQVLFSARCMNR